MTPVLLLWLLGWSAPAWTTEPLPQTPPLSVVADLDSGHRAVVRAGGVLDDPELEQAARAGLPIRLRFRVELWRDGFFDELSQQESWSIVLVQDPLGGGFTVRMAGDPESDRGFDSYEAAREYIETEYALSLRPTRQGRYYYVSILEIETLSLSDLEELETWLRGELQPAVAGDRSLTGAIGRGLKRAVIRLLGMPTRRFRARSEIFVVT